MRPLFEKAGQRYERCGACGFRFATAEQNANLENRLDDFEAAYRQYLGPSSADEVNHAATVAWIERFVRLDGSVRLLDVGVGSGKFLSHLRATRHCAAAGIEPSPALYAAYDLGRFGVVNSTLPAYASSAPAAFHVVTVLDVIEHVVCPMEFARALAAVTAAGGVVFVSTPDASSALATILGRWWHHYNRYHFSLFDRRTIRQLGEAAGFVTVDYAHRAKRMPVAYLRTYLGDFLVGAGSGRPGPAGWAVPVNLFDIMSVVWRKSA